MQKLVQALPQYRDQIDKLSLHIHVSQLKIYGLQNVGILILIHSSSTLWLEGLLLFLNNFIFTLNKIWAKSIN